MSEQQRQRKGILLAGGSGSRMAPMTRAVNKHLVPVYDKPLIYYPLSTLMTARVRDILVITGKNDLAAYCQLLGTGADWGLNLTYAIQSRPAGIADALRIAEKYLEGGPSVLVLGDNLFVGNGLRPSLNRVTSQEQGATIFAYPVSNPRGFGVIELSDEGKPLSLAEKPNQPRSNYAVPGLYFYDGDACEIAKNLRPSYRDELEITDVNREYMRRGQLKVEVWQRDMHWTDAGTPEALLHASQFVQEESRQGRHTGCLEEIAWRNSWITSAELAELAKQLSSDYGFHLRQLADRAALLDSDRNPTLDSNNRSQASSHAS